MISIFAHLSGNEQDKHVYTGDNTLYHDIDIEESKEYLYDTLLDRNQWFYIKDFSNTKYAIDCIKDMPSSVDKNLLMKEEIINIQYIYFKEDNYIYFQKITPSKVITNKRVLRFAIDGFEFKQDDGDIHINKLPDAIYDKKTDRLYFKKIENIQTIFTDIEDYFEDASNDDIKNFQKSLSVVFEGPYDVKFVGKSNRKRIKLAHNFLSKLNKDKKNKFYKYVEEYHPKICKNNSFHISDDTEFKNLLFACDMRYYKTIFGNEKRVANSIEVMKTDRKTKK